MNPFFPATHSILSTQVLLEDVLPDYEIGSPLECKFLNLGLNDTYQVETNTGRYILRVYRAGWRSESDIRYELDNLLHLKQRGVSVSYPLHRKDGELLRILSALEGPRPVVLFTYAPGKDPKYEADAENEAHQYGRSVAQIHAETDGFHSQHKRFPLDLTHLLDQPLKSIQPFYRHRPEDWAYLQALSEKLRQRVTDFPIGALEQGFCHGDFHGWNANLENGRFTYYDFDCCGLGWRAYDMAVFRWGQRANGGKDKALWPHFLKGYQEVRPIQEIDLQATHTFVAIRHLWLLGLHTANGKDWGYNWMNDGYFDQAVKFFKDWEAEPDQAR